MFGSKKEETKETITVNPDNLSMENRKEEIQNQQSEITIADIIANHETRLQALEAALFRIKGSI